MQYLDYLAALKGISKEAAREKNSELLELVGLAMSPIRKWKKILWWNDSACRDRYRQC